MERDGTKGRTALESAISNLTDRCGDIDGLKVFAMSEAAVWNYVEVIGEADAAEILSAIKGFFR